MPETSVVMLDLVDELRKVITVLEEKHIEYALCGGLAMAIYNQPRATVDIDLLIASESLDTLIESVAALGYEVRGLDMSFSIGAIEIRRVSKIDRVGGQVLSLDLLLVTPAIQHVWDARVVADWEHGTLSVVSLPGLIALKRLRHSMRDLADIEALQEEARDEAN